MRRAFGSLLLTAGAVIATVTLLSGHPLVGADDEATPRPRKTSTANTATSDAGDQKAEREKAGRENAGRENAEREKAGREKEPARPAQKRPDQKADQKADQDKPDREKPKATGPSPKDEAAAMAFAREHHPELADLLEQLKKGNKAAYEKAIAELLQTTERIAKIREPKRHEAAVAVWKVDSRIRLLSARMVMSENPALEAEMSELLRQRAELRIDELKAERERITARLEKIDDEIAKLESDPAASVKRELSKVKSQVSLQSQKLRKDRKE